MKQKANFLSIVVLAFFLQGCRFDVFDRLEMLEKGSDEIRSIVSILEKENEDLKLKVAELESQVTQKKSNLSRMFK